MEMSEIRSIIGGATSKSLVLVDEICRGTETAKGTCIAGSIIENFDKIGCLGIVSTHLHGVFSLKLDTKNTVFKAMGTEEIDGQTKPTWKLIDGICKESLAFETARGEGVPDAIISRAEELYFSLSGKDEYAEKLDAVVEHEITDSQLKYADEFHNPSSTIKTVRSRSKIMNSMERLQKEVASAITKIYQEKLIELYNPDVSQAADVTFVTVASREQPPPSTIGASSVYVLLRPDQTLYVGQVPLRTFILSIIIEALISGYWKFSM